MTTGLLLENFKAFFTKLISTYFSRTWSPIKYFGNYTGPSKWRELSSGSDGCSRFSTFSYLSSVPYIYAYFWKILVMNLKVSFGLNRSHRLTKPFYASIFMSKISLTRQRSRLIWVTIINRVSRSFWSLEVFKSDSRIMRQELSGDLNSWERVI